MSSHRAEPGTPPQSKEIVQFVEALGLDHRFILTRGRLEVWHRASAGWASLQLDLALIARAAISSVGHGALRLTIELFAPHADAVMAIDVAFAHLEDAACLSHIVEVIERRRLARAGGDQHRPDLDRAPAPPSRPPHVYARREPLYLRSISIRLRGWPRRWLRWRWSAAAKAPAAAAPSPAAPVIAAPPLTPVGDEWMELPPLADTNALARGDLIVPDQ